MGMVPRLKVSSDRLVKSGIKPATPGLQDNQFIHYTTAALLSPYCAVNFENNMKQDINSIENSVDPDQLTFIQV